MLDNSTAMNVTVDRIGKGGHRVRLVLEKYALPDTTVTIGRHPGSGDIYHLGFSHEANLANPTGLGVVNNYWSFVEQA